MLLTNAELLNKIDKEVEAAVRKNKNIRALYQRIRDGTATFESCSDLSIEIGNIISRALSENIIVTIGTNGKISFFTANEVIRPELVKGYDYTASYFNEVQKAYFESQGLNIQGAKPDIIESRINGFVEKLTADEYEAVKWLLEDPAYIVNYLEAVVDTGIKNNTGLLAQSGIRSKIIREIDSGACPWCMNLAGEYEYGEEPDDVYRRHRDCHCKVTYEFDKNFRQDSWGKGWFVNNPDYEWQQKQYESLDGKVMRNGRFVPKQQLTPKQARELENILLNQ